MNPRRLPRLLAFFMSLALILTLFRTSVSAELLPSSDWHDGPVFRVHGNTQVDNPYADYITNEEVAKLEAKDMLRPPLEIFPGFTLAKWSGRKGYDSKVYIQKEDGTMEPQGFIYVSDDPSISNMDISLTIARTHPGEKLGYYTVIYGDKENAASQGAYYQYIQKVNARVYEKNEEPDGGACGLAIKMKKVWIPTKAEVNGDVVYTSANYPGDPSDIEKNWPNIRVDQISKKTYLHFMTMEPLPENMVFMDWYLNLNTVAANQGGVARNEIVLKRQYACPQATFHFVMDRAYRHANSIVSTDPVKGRNHGELIYANKAVDTIEGLEPLADPYVTTSVHFDPEQDEPQFAGTLLRPTGGDPSAHPYSYYETDLGTQTLLNGEDGAATREKPTYAELAATVTEDENNVYVNVANDIDWPEDVSTTGENAYVLDGTKDTDNGTLRGNHLVAPAVDDEGHLRLMKHYYLTYRELPACVEMDKVDATTAYSDTPTLLPGAEFSLYRAPAADGEEPHLIAEKLTTDADGKLQIGTPKTKDELTALVKDNDWLGFYDTLGIYMKANSTPADIYLVPGQYILRETNAPTGYKLPAADKRDISLTVTKPTFDENGLVEVQKIKASNAPYTYPVPFRLTKTDSVDTQRALPGAVFALYKGESGEEAEQKIADGLITDQNGKLMIGEVMDKVGYEALLSGTDAANASTDGYFKSGGKTYLLPGKYYLVETQAPEGYETMTEAVPFELTTAQFDQTTGKAVLVEKSVTNVKKTKPTQLSESTKPTQSSEPTAPTFVPLTAPSNTQHPAPPTDTVPSNVSPAPVHPGTVAPPPAGPPTQPQHSAQPPQPVQQDWGLPITGEVSTLPVAGLLIAAGAALLVVCRRRVQRKS